MSAPVLFVAETRTGRVLTDGIPLSGIPKAGWRINTEGPLSFTIPMSYQFNKRQITDFLYPWKYSFGIRIGSFILQYGPLTGHPEYDPDGESWGFDCAGIWSLFNRKRYLVFTRDYTSPPLSRRDIFRKLLVDDMAQVNGDLPIDIPPADGIAGPGALFEWAKFSPVGELLRDQTDDGDTSLEAEFRPYFTDTTTMAYVRHWTNLAPYLGRQDRAHQWISGRSLVTATPVGGGDRIADLYIVPGQTSGDEFLYGAANAAGGSDALQSQNWPLLMDLDTTHTSSASQDELDGYAAGNFSAFHRGPRLIKARVRINPRAGEGPRLGDWDLGDYGYFQVTGYLGVPNGTYVCRVIGAELATLEDLDLELMLISELI